MGKYIYWTQEEDQIMKDNYAKIGLEVQKLLPHRTASSIKNRAAQLNLIFRPPYASWTQEEVDILRAYYPLEGKSCANRLPEHTVRAVQAMAIKLDIKKNKYK